MKKINQMEDAATLGQNPFMMAGRMTDSTATVMENAASNPNGAMNGFVGMGMGMNMSGMGGFNAAQGFYNTGLEMQKAQAQSVASGTWKCSCGAAATGKFCAQCGAKKPEAALSGAWKCACGATANGNFCPECGAKKPAGAPLYRCDKCGWEPEDPKNPPKFCPECGDRFDEGDIR
jgi:membrane protease subunit (stomatin/prohibitin family)